MRDLLAPPIPGTHSRDLSRSWIGRVKAIIPQHIQDLAGLVLNGEERVWRKGNEVTRHQLADFQSLYPQQRAAHSRLIAVQTT